MLGDQQGHRLLGERKELPHTLRGSTMLRPQKGLGARAASLNKTQGRA